MNRLFALPFLVLVVPFAVFSQESLPDPKLIIPNAPTDSATTPAAITKFTSHLSARSLASEPNLLSSTASETPIPAAEPAASPAPAPQPRFVYGGRDDYRWQLGFSAAWYRFRSSFFNASAVGVKTSLTYFTNEWFGVEGNVTGAFAPAIVANEHVKLLVYGGGPKIAKRERNWEPWLHVIVGGSHEQPQVAGSFSRNSFAVEAGGGADYRLNPRLSGRLEGNWVHTNFFAQTQNNFELNGGLVFHF